MKINKKYIAIAALIFIVYNFLFFFIGGVSDHSITYWASYLFEIVSLISVVILLCQVQRKKASAMKIFFLGFPIAYWSCIYTVLQLCVSITFMIVDDYLKAAILLQLILMITYAVIVLLCMRTKEMIEEIQESRSVNTQNMKKMASELKVLYESIQNAGLKSSVFKLYEEFRFSDTVSSPATFDIEEELNQKIDMLKNICNEDVFSAEKLMREIMQLLEKRNVCCADNKSRY